MSRKGSIAHLALAAYAAGNASDHPIANLILTEENTAKAASAAVASPSFFIMLPPSYIPAVL